MAHYSPIFKAMLMGKFDEAKQDEVPVTESKYDDFLELLNLIHHKAKVDGLF